jgi:hypothetical protein
MTVRPYRSRFARAVLLLGLATCVPAALQASSAMAATEPPSIAKTFVDGVGPNVATLDAQILPNGADTTYRFEYGGTHAYGSVVPAQEGDAGSGSTVVRVEQSIGGLAPDTTYHYRLIAKNSAGTQTSEDGTFSTFGVETFTVAATNADGSPDLQAGSHPYEVTASFRFPLNTDESGEPVPAGAVKDATIDLPPGLLGDPRAVPECPARLLAGEILGPSHCPPDTQVGVLHLQTPAAEASLPVYNLIPPEGTPAQFGVFALIFPITMNATVRSSDYGMSVSLANLSQVLPIAGASLSLWGVPADPGHDPYRGTCLGFEGTSSGSCPSESLPTPFLTMPANCGSPLTVGIYADSWKEPGDFVAAHSSGVESEGKALALNGCDRLQFDPRITVQPDTTSADAPVGLAIDVATQPTTADPNGLAAAGIREMALDLPEGMSIDPSAGDGLSGCLTSQIGLGEGGGVLCADSSKIGSAEVETPLLEQPLTGSVYLAQPNENPFGELLAAYVVVEGDGVTVKVPLYFSADPVTGRLVVHITAMPQLPFSHFKLDLHGGPRAALAGPGNCGTFPMSATFTPYSAHGSGPPVTVVNNYLVNEGCPGSFTPSFTAGPTSLKARGSTGFIFQLDRADGQQNVQGLSLTLPPGLLANLGSVPTCDSADATNGFCAASSQIGTATIAAGAGAQPFYLAGTVFLTGPYRQAPFGLSIVVPVHVGPFDLSTIVLRAQVALSSSDLRLRIIPDQLPQILSGIPLRLRTIHMAIDRPGFLFNPSDCTEQAIDSTVESTAGEAVSFQRPMRVIGCSGLRFSPRLAASVNDARATGEVGVNLGVTVPSRQQSGIRTLTVSLGGPLRPRLRTIQQACPLATFRENQSLCPAGSLVGHATMTTPMLGVPLSGPVRLVFRGGTAYPDLIVTLKGDGLSIVLDGVVTLTEKGVTTTTFPHLPDAPISKFTLNLSGGAHSILGAVGNICAERPTLRYAFTADNGLSSKGHGRISAGGCAKGKAVRSR